MIRATCLIVVLLSACSSTPPTSFPGPNGRPAYSMRCGTGFASNLETCYRDAAALCPMGYVVVDRSYEARSGTTVGQRLVVECKG